MSQNMTADESSSSFLGNNTWVAPLYILVISNVNTVVSLALNLPHLFVIYSMPRERYVGARNNRTLLLYLAAIDICLALWRLPMDNSEMQHNLARYQWLCDISAIFIYTGHMCEQTILTFASVERLIAIRYPSKYKNSPLTKHMGTFYLAAIVAHLLIWIALTIVYHGTAVRVRGFGVCYIDVRYSAVAATILISVYSPMFIIFGAYAALLVTVYRQNIITKGEAGYAVGAAKIVVVIFVSQLLCWLPSPINMAMMYLGQPSIVFYYLVGLLSAFNGTTHPLIYGLMNRRYRRFVFRTFCRKQQTHSLGLALSQSATTPTQSNTEGTNSQSTPLAESKETYHPLKTKTAEDNEPCALVKRLSVSDDNITQ